MKNQESLNVWLLLFNTSCQFIAGAQETNSRTHQVCLFNYGVGTHTHSVRNMQTPKKEILKLEDKHLESNKLFLLFFCGAEI